MKNSSEFVPYIGIGRTFANSKGYAKVSGGNDKLYLLGHLCGYANGIQVCSVVSPGTVVGYVGNTGHCAGYSEAEKKDGRGSHLHLSIFKFEDDYAKNVIKLDEDVIEEKINEKILIKDSRFPKGSVYTYNCHNNIKNKYKLINPFDYSESRK